jgi:hypothetical protein
MESRAIHQPTKQKKIVHLFLFLMLMLEIKCFAGQFFFAVAAAAAVTFRAMNESLLFIEDINFMSS